MLDNFENNWVKDRPTIFDRVIPEDYVVPEPGPTIKMSNNFSYLDYFQLFVSNEIIEKIAVYTSMQIMQDTKDRQTSILRVLMKSRCSSVCIQLQTILLSLHLIVDFLFKMKRNGSFILLDFAQFLPVNVLKKLSAYSLI